MGSVGVVDLRVVVMVTVVLARRQGLVAPLVAGVEAGGLGAVDGVALGRHLVLGLEDLGVVWDLVCHLACCGG